MWSQLLSTAIGLFLMAAPSLLDYGGAAADIAHIAGPLAATFALIAVWEVTHGARWVNLVGGLVLVVLPLFVRHPPRAAAVSVASGALLVVLARVKRRSKRAVGGGWRSLWRGPTPAGQVTS